MGDNSGSSENEHDGDGQICAIYFWTAVLLAVCGDARSFAGCRSYERSSVVDPPFTGHAGASDHYKRAQAATLIFQAAPNYSLCARRSEQAASAFLSI